MNNIKAYFDAYEQSLIEEQINKPAPDESTDVACMHREINCDGYCEECFTWQLCFSEDINCYKRDLVNDQSLNTYRYITNALDRDWFDYIKGKLPRDLKMLNRHLIKNMPIQMSYLYLLGKIKIKAKAGESINVCQKCGKFYPESRAHLHRKCPKNLIFEEHFTWELKDACNGQ